MSDRVKKLEDLLRKASAAYYGGEDALISDAEFDSLKDELESLDPSNSFLSEVGAPADSALQKVRHQIAMGSLRKIKTRGEFDTWIGTLKKSSSNLEMAVQWKLDGVSIELVYDNGKFIQAITRGDGEVGEDVTHTIKNATGFPQTISVTEKVFVRCEALLLIDDWKTHFSDKANPRNAVSGLVRRTDGKGSQHIKCVAFDVLFDSSDFTTEKDRIDWLISEDFKITRTAVVDYSDVEKEVDKIEDTRDKLPFEIDGTVVKINSISVQEALGEHNGLPYWARAWKFAAMGGHTVLNNVTWTIGTHGTINPVANVEPVSVGGTTISNVTLHNLDEIERLGVAIGDIVEVVRAGDVIPKIVRVVSEGKSRQLIAIPSCPACGTSTKRDGPKLVCGNASNCEGAQHKKIKKWISKREIMFLGDSNLNLLVEAGVVTSIIDLYSLTVDTMVGAGLGKRMAEKILAEIEKSRKVTLPDFLGSLSIDMVGRSEAKNIVGHGVDTLDKWSTLDTATLLGFPGYQQTKAERISNGVDGSWTLIEKLSKILTIEQDAQPTSGKLSGQSFCFTGAMKNSRKVLEKTVSDNGGQVRSVSKDLGFLVIDDPKSTSSKAAKARKLGISMISEADFLKMIK